MNNTNGAPTAAIVNYAKPILPDLAPSLRWVRVKFNDEFIANSKRVLLARDGHRLTYYFPTEDVQNDRLQPARLSSDGRQIYDVQVGDRTAEEAAWSYPDPADEKAPLRGYVAFHWRKMDHWYEEEEEVFVHPRDPYHRIDTIQSSRHIRIVIDGVTVAESRRPVLLFETGLPVRYYLPKEDVRMDLLQPTRARTGCPYKGFASYWSAEINGQTHRNIVWGYEEPLRESQQVAGLVCFFNEKVDIYVDGQREARPETLWSG